MNATPRMIRHALSSGYRVSVTINGEEYAIDKRDFIED